MSTATFSRHASMMSASIALVLAAGASAQVVGVIATRRPVTGGHLINVFAVSDQALLSVSGGLTGRITTNAAGGFRQGIGTQSVFAPSGSQNWTTLDSFLTVGGGFNTTSNAWTGNSGTVGDPNWNVTYVDTASGQSVTVNSFSTPSNPSAGFTNPYTNAIPLAGGWYLVGTSTPVRSLASIASIRLPYRRVGGINYGASSAAAASAQFGCMLAQFYVSEWGPTSSGSRFVDWTNMRIFWSGGSATFDFRIGQVCTGDLNDDRAVDGGDLGALLNAWGPCSATCPADLNSDAVVDGADLGIMLNAWGPCTN